MEFGILAVSLQIAMVVECKAVSHSLCRNAVVASKFSIWSFYVAISAFCRRTVTLRDRWDGVGSGFKCVVE